MEAAPVRRQHPAATARRAADRRRAPLATAPFPAGPERRAAGQGLSGWERPVQARAGPASAGRAGGRVRLMAETEPSARVRQCRVAQVRCRVAPELRGQGRPAARLKAVPAEAGRALAPYPERELSVPVRVGPESPGRAGGSPPASAATEPLRAAAKLQAVGLHRALAQVGRAEAERCRREQLDPARGERAPPATTARLRAAGLGPFAGASDGAGRCRRTGLQKRWAGPPAHPDGQAKAAARSGQEPDAAARSVPPKERVARLAARVARAGQARGLEGAQDGAVARARPGRQAALPAARKAGVGRSGSPRPDAPALWGGPPAAGLVSGERQGVPVRRGRGAPARQAAGDVGLADRHRPTGPGQAGVMERRNCPATA